MTELLSLLLTRYSTALRAETASYSHVNIQRISKGVHLVDVNIQRPWTSGTPGKYILSLAGNCRANERPRSEFTELFFKLH